MISSYLIEGKTFILAFIHLVKVSFLRYLSISNNTQYFICTSFITMENSFGVPLEYQKTNDNLPIKIY